MEQITLDLIPSGSNPICHASQYDDGRTIRVNLTENGSPYTLSTETVELHVRKGDGNMVSESVAVVSGKTFLEFATTEQMTAISGYNIGELQLSKNGAVIGTLNFILLVEGDPMYNNGSVPSVSAIWNLQSQVNADVQNAFDTLGASGLPFNNAGTDLESTNVEDAIKEVNEKVEQTPSDVYTKEETDALLDTKADKTTLAAEYYDKDEIDSQMAGKVSTSTLESDYYTKAETDTKLDAKANKNTTYTKSQTDALLAEKANASDLDDYYTRSEVDGALNTKASKNSVYTKTETNNLLAVKADKNEVYDRDYLDGIFDQIDNAFTGVNTALGTKADKSTTYTKTETDNALSLKADKSTTYTKSEVDTALNLKADKSTTYTKSEVDTALNLKADKSTTYTKSEVDTALSAKADKSDTYTKAEVDEKVADVYPSIDVSPAPIASFETDIVLPLKSCIANIVASQASGTPTPSSPLPISGYTGVNLTRCGINAFDEIMELGDINVNGVYINSTTTLRSKNHFPVKASTSYYVTFNTDNNAKMYIAQYDKDLNFISWVPSNEGITAPRSITTASNCCYIAICFTSAYGTTYKNDVSFNYPSTDTTYHAYNGTTYAVSWQDEAGTVYGGNLDLTSGVLTVDSIKETVRWSVYKTTDTIGTYTRRVIALSNVVDQTKTSELCNVAPYLENYSSDTLHFYCGNTSGTPQGRLYVFLDESTLPVGFDDIEVCYPLATPVTYQLTPVQVQALLGVNNIYNDTNGDTEVTFRETVQKYVDDKISEL